MSEKEDKRSTRKLNPAIGLLALIVSFSALSLTAVTASGQQNPVASTFTSITNADGTLTISPAVGNVVASLNLGHINTWTANQTFPKVLITGASAVVENLFGNGIVFRNTGTTGRMRLDIIPAGTPTAGTESSSLCLWNDAGLSANFCFQVFQGNSIQIGGAGTALPIVFNMAGLACTSIIHIRTDGSTDFGCSPIVFGLSTTGVENRQGFQSVIAQGLGNSVTSKVISLPVAEPDTTYAVTCDLNTNLGASWVSGKTTTQFQLNWVVVTGILGAEKADCIITHQ